MKYRRDSQRVIDGPIRDWTTQDAESLYEMASWSDGYFYANDAGHVIVSPTRSRDHSMDVHTIVNDLKSQGITLPVLIRFQDVLRSRVVQLNEAFRDAIEEAEYKNEYVGVYPIKVNQLHEVVEEVLEAGRPYNLGLECGSKAELVAALPHLENDEMLLICNGYKDEQMLQLILTGQQLRKSVIPVMEKFDEFERLLGLAADLNVGLRLGVRVNVSTNGIGRWATSSGDHSKFGVSISELLEMVERLDKGPVKGALELIHFHLGSQIADIQTLKQAVREISYVYVHLRKRGVPIRYLDVGGGLGVNYESGFAGRDDSINYSLAEYANSVVYSIKEVCDSEKMDVPTIVSESGRSITAHHSILVVEALGAYRRDEVDASFEPLETDEDVIHDLYDALQRARQSESDDRLLNTLLEAYHDAVEKRKHAHSLFSLGYLDIAQKALADRIYWSTCRSIHDHIRFVHNEPIPAELSVLDDQLVDQYLCDFSVFQSILDHWAIGQRFPIMPLDRLDEEPTRRAVIVDLTCDSDGKVSRYVSADEEKSFLEVHAIRNGEPYHLCFFLMGAYQDIMGDMHNLFGRITEAHVYADPNEPEGYYIEKLIPGATIQEMLALVQYFPNDLHRRMNALIRQKVEIGLIRPRVGVEMLDSYDRIFDQLTYFKPVPPKKTD